MPRIAAHKSPRSTKLYDRTADEITLKFSDTKVTITGRNLLGLYDALSVHKVRWIQEGDDRYDERSESEPFISAIKIEKGI